MNQQKSLQQSVARLEKVAKDLTAEKTKHQKKQVPLDLSVSVTLSLTCFHCIYFTPNRQQPGKDIMKCVSEDDSPHWDFSVWFVINQFYLVICCDCSIVSTIQTTRK